MNIFYLIVDILIKELTDSTMLALVNFASCSLWKLKLLEDKHLLLELLALVDTKDTVWRLIRNLASHPGEFSPIDSLFELISM